MVSALVSGLSSSGSSPGQGHCVVYLTLTVPLSTKVYNVYTCKWLLGLRGEKLNYKSVAKEI